MSVAPFPSVPRVLFIGIDGCRQDCLSAETSPHIWSLKNHKHSAYSFESYVNDICWSGPGWSTLLTGVWRHKHGVDGNEFDTAKFDTYPNVFQRLRSACSSSSIGTVGSVVNWSPINDSIFRSFVDIAHSYPDDDEKVLSTSLELLRDPSIGCLFVHLDEIDHAGHEFNYGPNVPEYMAAIKRTDDRIARLLSALHHRRTVTTVDEDWLIIVTTDHGGDDFTHEINCELNRRTFIIVNGERVRPGPVYPAPLAVDIAPTILCHMNVKIHPLWNLDGRPFPMHIYSGNTWMDLSIPLVVKKSVESETELQTGEKVTAES